MAKKSPKHRRNRRSNAAGVARQPGLGQPEASKRFLWWAVGILFPFVLLALLEVSLRLTGFGSDTRLVRKVEGGGQVWWEINRDVARRYFGANPEFARQTEEGRFYFHKPENGYRIFCLGGSSMAGFPYNFNATMPGILYTCLRILFPQHTIEVINLGIAAVNSYAVRDLMREVVNLEPDVILIYTGHNEFYGALGVGSTFAFGQNRRLINLSLALARFRTYLLLQRFIRSLMDLFQQHRPAYLREDLPVMEVMAEHRTIRYDSDLFRKAADHFRGNLSETIQIAVESGVPVLLGNLVSNLESQPPFVSSSSPGISPDAKETFRKRFVDGFQHWEAGRYSEALAMYREALQIDSMEADLNFYMGKSHQALNEWAAADKNFCKARDYDVLRFRAPGIFNHIIKEVADQCRIPLVDIESAFKTSSPHQLVGRKLITDHLHPNAGGYRLMAGAFLDALNENRLLPEKVPPETMELLPDSLADLYITPFDLEVGRFRIRSLTSEWPFKTVVELPPSGYPEMEELLQKLVYRYIQGDLYWGNAHLQLARTLFEKQRYDEAIYEYKTVLNFYPEVYLEENHYRLLNKLAEAQIAAGEIEAAREALEQSIRLNNRSPNSRVLLGKVYMLQSNFRDAEVQFREAIQRDDQEKEFSQQYRSFVYYLWGGALTNLKQWEDAEKKFLEALRLNPQNKPAADFLDELRAGIQQARRRERQN